MAALYEKDWKYSWARVWCDSATRSLFSAIRSEGKENVPRDGSVLLAPNHCNTLMDALVILQDWKEATLFGARADIFRKPAVRKILRFLRILPIPRARDGAREVTHNRATMEEVAECLEHGMRFCMFCEGTHRSKHTLLPLKKIEERLPAGFMRIHRSYIVNLDKIREVNKNRVIMDQDTYLPIGDLYREAFRQYLDTKFLGK